MSDLKRKYEDKSESDDEPQEESNLKRIDKSSWENKNFDLFLLFENEKSMFHLVKNINLALTSFKIMNFCNNSDEFIILNENAKESIVRLLRNNIEISIEQLYNLLSNINVLNELKPGNTIQWPLESIGSAYHRAIVSELNIKTKIIHLNQSNGMASSSSSLSSSTYQELCSELNGSITEEDLLNYIYEKKFSKYSYGHKTYNNLTKRYNSKNLKKIKNINKFSFFTENQML